MIASRTGTFLLLALLGPGVAAAASEREVASGRLREVIAQHDLIPDQASALANLAWPDGGVTDPMVSALAREELIEYGDHAIPALRDRLKAGPRIFTADVLSALLETRLVISAGRPADYVATIDEALWSGSLEAIRLAMYSMRPYQFYRPALLPMIDRSIENPALLPVAIRDLAEWRDDRARFFLDELMRTGPDDCREPAAHALARIGGLALEPLRTAVLSEDPRVRALAVDALLPVTTVGELATLFEYLGRFPDDDPARIGRVQERATHLDNLLQAHQASESATPIEN